MNLEQPFNMSLDVFGDPPSSVKLIARFYDISITTSVTPMLDEKYIVKVNLYLNPKEINYFTPKESEITFIYHFFGSEFYLWDRELMKYSNMPIFPYIDGEDIIDDFFETFSQHVAIKRLDSFKKNIRHV